MTRHSEFGQKGEDLAAGWLSRKGFEILHRRWRHGRYEVDIIANLDGIFHFIEVKTRRSGTFGHPEEWVNARKIRNMMCGAAGWLYQVPGIVRVQYDVLAITAMPAAEPAFYLFEDVSV